MLIKICLTALIVTVITNAVDDHFRKATGLKEYKGSDIVMAIVASSFLTFVITGVWAIWGL